MTQYKENPAASSNDTDEPPEWKDALPPADTKRWVVRRKAQVVYGVRDGIISLEDACRRYNLSLEEFASWQRMIDQYGIHGLRVTRLREYRMAARKSGM